MVHGMLCHDPESLRHGNEFNLDASNIMQSLQVFKVMNKTFLTSI